MSSFLFLSHSHASGPFRVGSHHLARELARTGAEVVHLSTPLSLAHRVTGRVSRADAAATPRGTHTDDAGVTHLVPRTLTPRPFGSFRVERELARHSLPAAFDTVLIDQPLLWDASVRPLARTLVYRPTDLYPSGVKADLQRRIVTAADAVVATSAEVLRGLGDVDVPTLVLENGVDLGHVAASDSAARPAVCVYVGALDGRFDWLQVIRWAQARPDVRFEIAGPTPGPRAVPANVTLLGPVAYDAVPALLHGARVGLLPLSDDPLNAGRSPMKLHEYLGAGLSVVARGTPVIGARESQGLYTYDGPDNAEAALSRALAHPSPNLAGAAGAAASSWPEKTRTLRAFLASLPTR